MLRLAQEVREVDDFSVERAQNASAHNVHWIGHDGGHRHCEQAGDQPPAFAVSTLMIAQTWFFHATTSDKTGRSCQASVWFQARDQLTHATVHLSVSALGDLD